MMIKNQNIRIYFIFSLIYLSIFSIPTYASDDKNFNSDIQAIIDTDRQALKIPGVEVSILYPEDTSPRDFISGTIKINESTPVQTNTFFQIGSETKSFVAAIMLQLEAEGKLNINDKIEKWLPNIPPTWKGVTIKQLLNHTSGLYNYTDVLDEMFEKKQLTYYEQWSLQDLVNLVFQRPSYFQPGMGWHYSNTNYILAGLIIETVTGNSINTEFNTRLIKPLNLQNTFYIPTIYDNKIMQRMAHGYAESGYFENEPYDVTNFNSSWASAAGAIISTSHDMAIWFKTLMNGTILPAKQMAELLSLVDQNDGQSIPDTKDALGYGLALMHDLKTFGEESWWHTGGTLGYSASMLWLKCHNVIITSYVNDITAGTWSKRALYFLTQDLVAYVQKSDYQGQCYRA